MSDKDFQDRMGIEVPHDETQIRQRGLEILQGMALMSPEKRAEFVATLHPSQRRLLDMVEMPELDDVEALNDWLDT